MATDREPCGTPDNSSLLPALWNRRGVRIAVATGVCAALGAGIFAQVAQASTPGPSAAPAVSGAASDAASWSASASAMPSTSGDVSASGSATPSGDISATATPSGDMLASATPSGDVSASIVPSASAAGAPSASAAGAASASASGAPSVSALASVPAAASGTPSVSASAPGAGSAMSVPSVVPTPSDSATSSQQMVGEVPVLVTDYGTLATDRHTTRVVSGYLDLTGQMELAWVADAGQVVGDAHCTQNIQTTPSAPARVRPTLMICWRTSKAKSVYTLAVNLVGAPSAADSVALLDQRWNALG